MKIFYRRPLSLILCIMLGAFSLFAKIKAPFNYLIIISAIAVFAISFIKPLFKKISKTLLRASMICLVISSLLSHLYFNFYYKAYERFDGAVYITGEITEISTDDYYTDITLKTYDVDFENFSSYKLLLTLDYEERKKLPELNVGNIISFDAKITDFKNDKSDFNANSYYHSKGFSGKITELENFEFLGEKESKTPSFFKNLRADTCEFIIEKSDKETGGLLIALLLGEKEFLSPALKLDFKRIGISHILALSGMHLAILAFGLSKLLSLFGIPKKMRTLISILFTACYMALTGFPVSVVRAGLMLIISSLLFVFAKTSDSLTNLLISVFIIVLINPYSIFDISLLLSAFATLGIVALGDLPKIYRKKISVREKVLNSLAISLFAISATFLVSVLSFGEISLISPVSTLIFSVLVELFIYFGISFMIFASFLPLAAPLSFLGGIIKDFAAKISSIRYITVSSEFLFIKISAVIFTIIFFGFLILNIKRKRIGVAIVSSFMCLILVCGSILTFSSENKKRATYLLSENGDALLITDSEEISLIESKTYTAGRIYETIEFLKDEKLTRLDNYVLTDYNKKLPGALYALLSQVKISNIYLPKPSGAEEREIYNSIAALEEVFNVSFTCYDNERIDFDSFSFRAEFRKADIGIFEILFQNKKYLLLTSGVFESAVKNFALSEIRTCDYLILSKHGKRYNDYRFVYQLDEPSVIIASSKGLDIPDYIKLFYKKSGVKIYSTPEKYDFIR